MNQVALHEFAGKETRRKRIRRKGATSWLKKKTRRRQRRRRRRTTIDDWMVRISFAEAGEADLGFKATGLDIVRKTKLALEKIMVVRSEKASREQEARKEQEVTRERRCWREAAGDDPG